MKKSLTILFLAIYLPAAVGVGIQVHFCGGKSSGISLFAKADESCCCGKAKPRSCCSDKWGYVKLDSNSHVSGAHAVIIPASTVFALPPVVPVFSTLVISKLNSQNNFYSGISPGEYDSPDLCVWNCTFLI